jgi:transcriptional regulator with GAF, ATPase, and Fis domain
MLNLDGFSDKAAHICFHSSNVDDFLINLYKLLSGYMPIDFIKMACYVEATNQMYNISQVERGVLLKSNVATDMPSGLSEKDICVCDEDVFYMSYDNAPLPSEYLDFIGLKGNSDIVLQIKGSSKVIGALVIRAFKDNAYNDYHKNLLRCLVSSVSKFFFSALVYNKLIEDNVRLIGRSHDLIEFINKNVEDNAFLVGADGGLKKVVEMASSIAAFPSTVLLTGETGVGKDVIANYIHINSLRKDEPFIKVNCGSIPESLVDNELFGHEKGAFTGAETVKNGRFHLAHKGTLFFDEIGELPLASQVKLLRAIQFGEIERLGNGKTIKVDVRIIAATNRNLREMVKEGRFREDLYWRLNVFPIEIPPLRKRREDIPEFAGYLVEKKCHTFGIKDIPKIPDRVMERIKRYDWPGNVREMENIIERELIINKGKRLNFDCVIENDPCTSYPESSEYLDSTMKKHIITTLEQTRWKISGDNGAAEKLGMNPSTLRNKMRKLGIAFKKY